ncbi:MAG TPA: efflux transporter outer membrane subunit [Bordetella sp.]
MNVFRFSSSHGLAVGLALALSSCASVGPDFHAPEATAPADWRARPTSAAELAASVAPSTDPLPASWWEVFGDPTLDALQARAIQASPDLQTATLRFAQARLQRRVAASQALPQVDLDAQAARQRQSEESAETRLAGALGGASAPQLVQVLSEPFSLYQAGFDVSWELDLWGRVRRLVEAADAGIEAAQAQLQDTRLVLSSELARAYFELRQVQRQQALLTRDVAVARDLLALRQAQAANGLTDADPPLAQSQRVAQLAAQRAALQARQAALDNQIGLLTGDAPGALNALLAPASADLDQDAPPGLPALALGQPADLLRRRPDVRGAEARLHAATAEIGVAVADLYPRIGFDASAGFQSLDAADLGDWGSRTWQVGPVLSLPVFDRGRRRANVELRRKDQQLAAVAWHQRVLKSWQEVDDALNDYAAEHARNARLREREAASREQLTFARVRAGTGLGNDLSVLQAELAWRQTQADVAESDCALQTALVRVYKASGGGTAPAPGVANASP